MKKAESNPRFVIDRREDTSEPMFMRPAIFISASVSLGLLFALQEWVYSRAMGSHLGTPIFFESWGVHFLLWGTLCWLLWRFLRSQVQHASILSMLAIFLPVSVVISVLEEMLFLLIFPGLPITKTHWSYWSRLETYLDAELVYNMLIFWCAFFLFRGIGYYQRYRENERAAAQLEIQLANAQLSALRMQLNPHFLFNTMNSISSLMRIDIDAADAMLEQLSCLMRITLERGDAQFITLRDEMDFIETYLAMQARRHAGRVEHDVMIDPELYDALVPCMLLQPIVENAYMHGLSKIDSSGELSVKVQRDGTAMRICVANTGVGLKPAAKSSSASHGLGLANVKNRLKLHYGDGSSFSMVELDPHHVQVTIRLPLQFSPLSPNLGTGYESQ